MKSTTRPTLSVDRGALPALALFVFISLVSLGQPLLRTTSARDNGPGNTAREQLPVASPARSAARVPLSTALNADGTVKLGAGLNGSFDVSGFRMELTESGAPRFVPQACGVPSESWDSQFGMSNGPAGPVFALAVSGSDLYVGGLFTFAGNVLANGIARFNTTAGTWSALGSGGGSGVGGGWVEALAVNGSDLYVGGFFTTANLGGGAGEITVNNVARYSITSGTWSTLGSGTGKGVS